MHSFELMIIPKKNDEHDSPDIWITCNNSLASKGAAMNWDQFHTTNSPQMLHAWMLLPVAPKAGVPPWTGKWPIEIVDLPNSRMVIVHRQCKTFTRG